MRMQKKNKKKPQKTTKQFMVTVLTLTSVMCVHVNSISAYVYVTAYVYTDFI